MYQNNSYQTQTGQVAPEAQNPQTGSVQPYQQQNISNFQAETQSLLEGQSGVSLILPSGDSAISPTGSTTVTRVQSESSNNYPIITLSAVIVVTLILGILLLKFSLKAEEPIEDVAEEHEEVKRPKSIKVTTTDSKTIKSTKKKQSTSKNKRKKRNRK